MAAGVERKYLVRNVDGEEFGPVVQENLIRWTESGRVTGFCEVRSTMIKKWEFAKDVSFLKDIIAEMAPPEPEHEPTVFDKISEMSALRAPAGNSSGGITKLKAAEYDSAAGLIRAMAGLYDMLICGIGVAIFYAALAYGGLLSPTTFYLWIAGSFLGVTTYLAVNISMDGQSYGCSKLNIKLIHNHEKHLEVLLGRAFFFAVFSMIFSVFTPLMVFIMPSGRAFPDYFTNTRMVRAKLKKKNA